jgi:chaperonin GroES
MRKDRRKRYYRSKQFDRSCRPGGSCPYCLGNRLYNNHRRRLAADDEISRFLLERNMAKIKPIGDRILVQVDNPIDKTPGGILLPDMAKEKPQMGTVLTLGTGLLRTNDGTIVPFNVKEGDKVLFNKYGCEPIPGSAQLVLVRELDLLAIVVD